MQRARGDRDGSARIVIRFANALIVDRSSVARQLVSRLLTLQAKRIEQFAGVDEARAWCASEIPDVVVVDAEAEGSLDWLETWDSDAPRPAFVFVTSRPTREEETRVTLLGAIGYLAKPFTYQQLASALASSSPFFEIAPPRIRTIPLARAAIEDPETGEQQISCEVRDISVDGAFLAAAAPIARDTRLRLHLYLGAAPIALDARVVRIQEPSWGVTPGWGVVFDPTSESRRAIEAFVREKLDAEGGF